MNASEFGKCFDEIVTDPLTSMGFVKRGSNLFLKHGEGILALIRVQTKWSNFTQRNGYVMCIRHAFLRDLEERIPDGFISEINDYPFKIRPSALNPLSMKTWHYESINLGLRSNHFDEIDYGSISDATEFLTNLCVAVKTVGIGLLNYLTPETAFKQIKKYGERAYCENLWIEDYKRYLDLNGSKIRRWFF